MGWLLEGPGAQVSNWGGCGIWGQWRNLFVWVSMRHQGTPAHPRAAAGWMGCLTPAAGGSIVSLCVCTCVRMCVCVYVCVHVPTGNTPSALLLAGPGGLELQQLHLCQGTRCGQLLTHWPCLKFS